MERKVLHLDSQTVKVTKENMYCITRIDVSQDMMEFYHDSIIN